MSLTFTVLRCPESVAPETRHVAGGEFSVGRGPGVDWVLPDPERILSKRHFVIAFRGGGWQLADTSTNGTFLNREASAVGHNEVRSLRDGDRVRVGQYEIELRLAEDVAPNVGGAVSGARAQGAGQGIGQRFAFDDPFAPIEAEPFLSQPPSASGSLSDADLGLRLPADFDPLAPDPGESPFSGPTQPDHSPVLEDAFHPPRPTGSQLPDDWDSALEGILPPGAQSSPPESSLPVADPGPSPFDSPVAPPTPRAAAPPMPAPVSASPGVAPARVAQQDDGLLAAFLQGAGLPDVAPADPATTMRQLGEAFRALVGGLRAVLIARAAIKSEFRIEQTMIRARGNNPLKFSAGEDDALTALLGAGRRTDMEPAEAVADALRDLRLHELASMSAMQTAVRTLLERLDPARLRAPAEQGGLSLLSAQRKARAWDAYEALHAQTVQALADDFDSVFGKAFARAYERALSDVAAKEQP